MIIFDVGAGGICENNLTKARALIYEIASLNIPDSVVKFQLFKNQGDNIPLDQGIFGDAFHYASILRVGCTASVFDEDSLEFLLTKGIPFVKIANNKDSHKLIKKVPEDMPIVISTDDKDYKIDRKNTDIIYTISDYPAKEKDYEKFGDRLNKGMSDHTTNFNLFWKYGPHIYEVHFKQKDSNGPNSGEFARTLDQCREMTKFTQEPKA